MRTQSSHPDPADDTGPGPVPPMGPSPTDPDRETVPVEPDSPGQNPTFPPGQAPFPDRDEPPADHPASL